MRARHGGRVPENREALLRLPGVGAYSAGAVASIAFGERVPVVDGNVIRVLTRLFALRGDPGRAPLRARLWSVADELVPEKRPGDFNQALMELGATLCTPRKPACERCPLARECLARERGTTDRLPELPARARATDVRVAAAVVRRGRRLLVVQVPDGAPRWAGLHVFPFVTLEGRESSASGARRAAREHYVRAVVGERLTTFKYTVTRFRMTLEAFEAKAAAGSRGRFLPASELDELAMPTPHRRLAKLVAEREA
jgi:A/G-specific adenine glycosylase